MKDIPYYSQNKNYRISIDMIEGLTDIHCHLLPYVDDGAENLTESKALLRLQAEQGVSTVYLTVHMRHHMFETPREEVEMQFQRLKDEIDGDPEMPQILLGRENHCDRMLLKALEDGTAMTMGNSRFMLLEFHDHSSEDIRFFVSKVQELGFEPIIAHVERYPAVHRHPDLATELAEKGAWLQMNTEGLLGKEGSKQKKFCWNLMKSGVISFVGSDAHHVNFREPDLGECARVLSRKLSGSMANTILYENPARLKEEIRT